MLSTKKDFSLKAAKKTSDYLICIDSDGCVFDTMNAKHKLCFAPLALSLFGITEQRESLFDFWQDVNLYSATRGVNRFKGIAKFLTKAIELGALKFSEKEIGELNEYCSWAKESPTLSNAALEETLVHKNNSVAKTILDWSIKVNKKIASLSDAEKKLFVASRNLIALASTSANVAVVSSAPAKEIHEEWEHAHLTQYVDTICTQEDGGKGKILKEFLSLGYDSKKVLMIGDALSDLENAKKNNCVFYPVIPDEEEKSWHALEDIYFHKFLLGTYQENCEEALIQKLKDKLPNKNL